MVLDLQTLRQNLEALDPDLLVAEIERLRGEVAERDRVIAERNERLAIFQHVPVNVAHSFTREANGLPRLTLARPQAVTS